MGPFRAGELESSGRETPIEPSAGAAMSRISAVILAYNRPELLDEALRSVQAQTRRPDEVIVVDDHSEPPLGPQGVRIIRQEVNRGPAAAAARGLEEAAGELVAFLNDDDVWAPTFLEALSRELDAHPEAVIAFCDHGVIDDIGTPQTELAMRMSERYGRRHLPAGVVSLPKIALLGQTISAASFALVRRDAVSPALLRAGGDIWDYFLPMGAALTGRPGVYVDERLGWYRLSPAGVSAQWARPEKGISARLRHVAAARVALASPAARGIRAGMAKRGLRNAALAMALAFRSGPRVAGRAVYDLMLALLAPLRPPPRRR